MKNVIITALAVLSLSSCKTKAVDTGNLPKDISLKPDNNLKQQQDKEQLSSFIKEIDALIQAETCDDAADWAFTAIGAKPCGGPGSYIAYPKKREAEILPKIQRFTEMQSAFNKKYQLISDCMMIMPPAEIKCEGGKAVLVSGNSGVGEVQ